MNSLSKLIRDEKSLYWDKKKKGKKSSWGFNMVSRRSKDPIKGYVGDKIAEQIKRRKGSKYWVDMRGVL